MFIEITDQKGDKHLVNVNNILELSACEITVFEGYETDVAESRTEMVYSLILMQNRHIYLTEAQWLDTHWELRRLKIK